MSARSWVTCPKCLLIAEQAQADRISAAEEAYGKVSAEEYRELLDEAEEPVNVGKSLREDYDIGVSNGGRFEVSYRASCTQCDFAFNYDHSQAIEFKHEPKPKPKPKWVADLKLPHGAEFTGKKCEECGGRLIGNEVAIWCENHPMNGAGTCKCSFRLLSG